MTDTSNMPTYVSHKKVGALEIEKVEGPLVWLKGRSIPVECPQAMFTRYTPVPGDFFVRYEDGYESFSPRKAFVEGYKLVDDRTFTDIKQEIKNG